MAKYKITSKILSLLMVLMLIISCVNITALAAGPGDRGPGGGGSRNDSVDHIDIGISLTADITIDGVTYQDLQYTLTRSDISASTLQIYSTAGNYSYSLSNISESTSSYGLRQYRISGNFPVGTQDDPIYYTVNLTKTVTVNTNNGPVQVPVTFSATFHYWSGSNHCPGLGRDWSSGGVSNSSGLDFLLGNAEEDIRTNGTISIQKTVSGLELAEGESKTYTFDIYTAAGALYDTISITIGSGSTTGLATISEVPYGTYYIVERDASAEGYTLVTQYTVGASTTADKSADIVLSAENPDGAAHVVNTYEAIPTIQDLTEVSVSKIWNDNGNPDRPAQVTVRLLCDGQYFGDAVALNAGNNWSHTWAGLDAGYAWSVIELNVPEGYTVDVQADEAGLNYTITNSMDYEPPTEPPTEPETEPTEPETEPTEPETEPTEPETEPTEPETEPTEPETEPTEPETEPPVETTEPGGGDPDPQSDDGMADVPQTGSALLLWIALGALSGTGLVMTLKKKED